MTTRFNDLATLAGRVDDTRHLKGTEGAKTVQALIDEAKKVLQRQHARILADQHFLDGVSMRTIAGEQHVSPNAVSLWIKDSGPKFYWTIRQEGEEFIAERVPPREARRLVAAGRRAIPATWGLGDQETLDGPVDGLWHSLASQA